MVIIYCIRYYKIYYRSRFGSSCLKLLSLTLAKMNNPHEHPRAHPPVRQRTHFETLSVINEESCDYVYDIFKITLNNTDSRTLLNSCICSLEKTKNYSNYYTNIDSAKLTTN